MRKNLAHTHSPVRLVAGSARRRISLLIAALVATITMLMAFASGASALSLGLQWSGDTVKTQSEEGRRVARVDTLLKLAGALEVAPAELLHGLAWHCGQIRRGGFSISHNPERRQGDEDYETETSP
jgi:hypothetical protein